MIWISFITMFSSPKSRGIVCIIKLFTKYTKLWQYQSLQAYEKFAFGLG